LFEQTFMKYIHQLEALQLHLLEIDAAIPWHLFDLVKGQLVFQSLEKVEFKFIVDARSKITFPGYQHPVIFPVLTSLRVTNAIGVYDNIYAYFTSNKLSRLVVKDDPDAFEHIDWRVLQTVQRFEIEHPTGEFTSHHQLAQSGLARHCSGHCRQGHARQHGGTAAAPGITPYQLRVDAYKR
ncbi:hypothetical protein DL89DRAFT_272590, partial [Linderina pennispora]